jgi:hypothetical protein
MTWTWITRGGPPLKSEDTLGLPGGAELQISSMPGDSREEMEGKVGFVTVLENNSSILKGCCHL